jgi:AraC-like DNA-binding protein
MSQDSRLRAAPPPWAHRFRTDDLDEVRAFVARSAGDHSRIVRGRGPLGFDMSWLAGAGTVMGWSRSDLRVIVRGAVQDPTLHLGMPAGTTYRIGRRVVAAKPGELMFVAPGWHYTLDRAPGSSPAFSVSGEALADELGAREHRMRFDLVLRMRAIPADEGARARLALAVDELARALDPSADLALVAHAKARLTSVLADLLLERSAAVRGQEVAAARIAHLEIWIEANLETPITIGQLCAVAGVGERALQKAVALRRGMSPMRFVMERRLAQARRQLQAARGPANVMHVANRYGFNHAGRFAMAYGQAFGESPSQTVRRSRR